jgi:hypothetical protein
MKIIDSHHFYNLLHYRRDILETISFYNELERAIDHKKTNQEYIDILKSILEIKGINIISNPNFFDDGEMEIPGEAKGIIIQKKQERNYTQIYIIKNPYNLEDDLKKSYYIRARVKNESEYDKHLYRALCNNDWYKKGIIFSCSWREAGGLVSEIKNDYCDYLDYYCVGGEGHVDKEIEKDLNSLGWKIKNG